MSLSFEEFSELTPKQKALFYSEVAENQQFQENLPVQISKQRQIKVKTGFPYASISRKYFDLMENSNKNENNKKKETIVTNKIRPSAFAIGNKHGKKKLFNVQRIYKNSEKEYFKYIPTNIKEKIFKKMGIEKKQLSEETLIPSSTLVLKKSSNLNPSSALISTSASTSALASSSTPISNLGLSLGSNLSLTSGQNLDLKLDSNLDSNNLVFRQKKMSPYSINNRMSSPVEVTSVVQSAKSETGETTQNTANAAVVAVEATKVANTELKNLEGRLNKFLINSVKNENFSGNNTQNNALIKKLKTKLSEFMTARKLAVKAAKDAIRTQEAATEAARTAEKAYAQISQIAEQVAVLTKKVERINKITRPKQEEFLPSNFVGLQKTAEGGSKKKRSSSKSKSKKSTKSKKTKTKKSSSRK